MKILFDKVRKSVKKSEEDRKSFNLKDKTLSEREAILSAKATEVEKRQKSIVEQRDEIKKMKRETEDEAARLKIWAEQLKAAKEKQRRRARAHNESRSSLGNGIPAGNNESKKQKGWEGEKSNSSNTITNGSTSSSPRPSSPAKDSPRNINNIKNNSTPHPPPHFHNPIPADTNHYYSPTPHPPSSSHSSSPFPSSSHSSSPHPSQHNIQPESTPQLDAEERKHNFLKMVNEMKTSRVGGGGRLQRVRALLRSMNTTTIPLSLHHLIREVNQHLDKLQLELDSAIYEMDDEARVLSESFYFQV